jgi:hypothetical protein
MTTAPSITEQVEAYFAGKAAHITPEQELFDARTPAACAVILHPACQTASLRRAIQRDTRRIAVRRGHQVHLIG